MDDHLSVSTEPNLRFWCDPTLSFSFIFHRNHFIIITPSFPLIYIYIIFICMLYILFPFYNIFKKTAVILDCQLSFFCCSLLLPVSKKSNQAKYFIFKTYKLATQRLTKTRKSISEGCNLNSSYWISFNSQVVGMLRCNINFRL